MSYKLKWTYQPEKRRTTLYLVNAETKQNITQVVSLKHPKDQNNKKIARAITFKKLMVELKRIQKFDRKERKEIGNLFNNTIKNISWKKRK